MNNVINYLRKYNSVDCHLETYSPEIVEKISEIINGKIEDHYDNHTLLCYAGIVNHRSGNIDTAIKYYTESALFGNPIAAYNLGCIYYINNPTLAIYYYQQSINYNDANVYLVWQNMGNLYAALGDSEKANKYYIGANERHPEFNDSTHIRVTCTNVNNLSESFESFESPSSENKHKRKPDESLEILQSKKKKFTGELPNDQHKRNLDNDPENELTDELNN